MSNIADNPGSYTDFTGYIKWDWSTECQVRNATFDILEKRKKYKDNVGVGIIFRKGTITGGVIYQAEIKDCHFYGNKLSQSVFHKGDFMGKEFASSYWLGGKWIDGTWGDYNSDKFGRRLGYSPGEESVKQDGVADKSGNYKNFTGEVDWLDCRFSVKNATFDLMDAEREDNRIIFHDGTITGGTIEQSLINYCTFEYGHCLNVFWKDGIFEGGIFEQELNVNYYAAGVWENGVFEGDTFVGGDWRNGVFKGGTFKSGTFEGGTFDGNEFEETQFDGGTFAGGEFIGGTWLSGTWEDGIWTYGWIENGDDAEELPDEVINSN